ncbi:MAG: type II CAAX endopeptidase family protein [Planctomycetota bacterium]
MTSKHSYWLGLLVVVTGALMAVHWNWEPVDGDGATVEALAFEMLGRTAVGIHELGKELDRVETGEQNAKTIFDQMKSVSRTSADSMRRAITEAEVRGPEPALRVLRDLPDDLEDREPLLRRYGGGTLDEATQRGLVERHGWFGELSNVYGLDDEDPVRRALLDVERDRAMQRTVFQGFVLLGFLFGCFLCARFVWRASRGRVPMRFALHDAGSGDLPWLQSVVLVLAATLFVSAGVLDETGLPGFAVMLLLLVPVFWPVMRGMPWREWTGGIGLRGGSPIHKEIGAGILGYLAGAPVILIGLLLTAQLSDLTGLQPDHPVRHELATRRDLPWWTLLLSVSIFPAIWEELTFRGAFYRYLRPRFSVMGASILCSVLFAVIHPQGLAGLPALGMTGIVLAVVREWRGSVYASMTVHALHNGFLLFLMFLMR